MHLPQGSSPTIIPSNPFLWVLKSTIFMTIDGHWMGGMCQALKCFNIIASSSTWKLPCGSKSRFRNEKIKKNCNLDTIQS
jgi:cellulase/cellobiase CelA1